MEKHQKKGGKKYKKSAFWWSSPQLGSQESIDSILQSEKTSLLVKVNFFYKFLTLKNQFYNCLLEMNRMKRKNTLQKEGPDLQQTELYDKITKLEVQILERIQKLKTNTKNTVCEHFSINSPECEDYDQRVNYYDKFWKRFLLNQIGKQSLLQFREHVELFSKRIEKIESLFEDWEKIVEPVNKAKKKSSKSEENEREICPHCQRAYKDQETLMIHIKVKHGEMANRSHRNEQDIYESDDL